MPHLRSRFTARRACVFGLLVLAAACPANPVGTAQASVDGSWTSIGGVGLDPGPRRYTHDGIYDPVRDRMIVFGGTTFNVYSSETWALDVATGDWSQISTVTTPPARGIHTTVYDPVRDRMIVIGGYDGTFRNDVWALSLSGSPAWTMIAPAGPAFPARGGHAAIYDPVGDRVVVFGGSDGASPPSNRRSDVWALSLSGTPTWTEITPAVAGPSARSGHSAVYDATRQRIVFFGGSTPAYLNDTWALSLSGAPTWSPVPVSGPLPAAREEHSAIYDPSHDRMIMVSGYGGTRLGDAWSLSFAGTPSWNQLAPCGTQRQWGQVAVLDSDHGQMLVHGGNNGADVFSDGDGSIAGTRTAFAMTLGVFSDWTTNSPGGGAGPRRRWAGFAYDPSRQAMWLFGGAASCWFNTVHRLSLSSSPAWQEVATQGTPPSQREQAEMIYDPQGDRLIVFGGVKQAIYNNDLWELSLAGIPTWTQLTPTGAIPAARAAHRMIYDASNHRVIMYGGYNTGSPPSQRLGDVWALNLDGPLQWSDITPSGPGPGPRSSHSFVYDPAGGSALMFGGTNSAGYRNDVWELSLSGVPTWTWINAQPVLLVRAEQSMILDPLRNRLVVFGGLAFGGVVGDYWALPLGSAPSDHRIWQQLHPTPGPGHPPTWGHAAAYDPIHDRMVLHAGEDAANVTSFITWSFSTAVQAAVVQAVGERGVARLEWELRGDVAPVRLDRRNGAVWTERATLSPDGRGRVSFLDRDVTAGGHYEYRLVDPANSEVLSQVTVDIPVERLALQSASYADGRVVIDCSLPGTTELDVELLDTSGRRAYQMTWYASRTGSQRIEFRTPILASGMYFARIRQAGVSQTRSFAIVR
jgi:hypothetical protein